jgi:hypothetical protein
MNISINLKITYFMKIHFITFGDTSIPSNSLTSQRRESAVRLCNQVYETRWVNSTKFYNLDLIKIEHPCWFYKHFNFIRQNHRGCGYWIWKSFIIFEYLKKINEGDILIYADAGHEISKFASNRFDEYIALTEKHSLLAFEINETIEKWTKPELLEYFDLFNNHNILNNKQIQAGLIFIKKSIKSLFLINIWQNLSIIDNYILINDINSNKIFNLPNYVEHRHDQSIFTLILRSNDFGLILPDEAYTPLLFNQGQYNINIPFQCLRNPTGVRMIN